MATPETRRQLLAAVAACDDKKGEDTRILELDPADSGLADFFLITSATNDRQVVAIADEIEIRLKKEFGLYATSVEGRRQAEWILLDYVDIVIHVFLAEKRAFYDIERLRKSARPLTSSEIEAELKAELVKKTRTVRGSAASPKKAASVTPSKSPATKATKPVAPPAKTSPQGDSKVTAKSAKKAAKKASFKPGKELKPAAVKASAPTTKPALKSAKKAAAKPATIPVSKAAVTSKMAKPIKFGARPPIVKAQAPISKVSVEAPDPSDIAPDLNDITPAGNVVGAQPPIVKRALPVNLAASAAPAAKKTAAKKAVAKKAAAKKAVKAPLKQAIRKLR